MPLKEVLVVHSPVRKEGVSETRSMTDRAAQRRGMSESYVRAVTKSVTFSITVRELAEWFAGLEDERQADFFEQVGLIMESWERPERVAYWNGAEGQQIAIGRHMRTCACVSEAGRRVIENIAYGMKPSA